MANVPNSFQEQIDSLKASIWEMGLEVDKLQDNYLILNEGLHSITEILEKDFDYGEDSTDS